MAHELEVAILKQSRGLPIPKVRGNFHPGWIWTVPVYACCPGLQEVSAPFTLKNVLAWEFMDDPTKALSPFRWNIGEIIYKNSKQSYMHYNPKAGDCSRPIQPSLSALGRTQSSNLSVLKISNTHDSDSWLLILERIALNVAFWSSSLL